MKTKIAGIFIFILLILTAMPNLSGEMIKSNNINDKQNSEFLLGEFIVKLTKDTTISNPSLTMLNEKYKVNSIKRVFKSSENTILNNIYILSIPEDSDISAIVDDYSSCPVVEYAEPNSIFYLSSVPNDENFSKQWALQNTGQNGGVPGADIDAPKAWNIKTGSSDITIAIIDTGVDYNHPDLFNNTWVNPKIVKDTNGDGVIDIHDLDLNNDNKISSSELNYYGSQADVIGWDFNNNDNDPLDDNGHGTHLAGIAAAVTNNGVGIAGVCWNCKIMSLKGIDSGGLGLVDNLANAIVYAADNGANVISMSWGNYISNQVAHDAIDYAYSKGVVLVAAAGNILFNGGRKYYPAAYDNVIAVAATDNNDQRAYFSNYGDWVDVAAPGEEIYSTMPTYSVFLNTDPYFFSMNYDYLNGTSMACPMVAGLAGLILSYNPNLTPPEVRDIIYNSTDWIKTDKYIGNGRINAYKALLIASGVTLPPGKPGPPSGPTNGHTGAEYTYTVTTTDPDGDELYYLFSWGDGTYSNWVGPFDSGAIGSTNHKWSKRGNYQIKVKARDSYGVESKWSDPLPITMPRNRAINNPFLNYLQNHPNAFPILRQLLNL